MIRNEVLFAGEQVLGGAANAVLYVDANSKLGQVAVNATATQKFLAQVSSGVPAFSALALSDIPAGVALTANPLSQFAATTSAQLLGVISDEVGTGALVFGTSPAITTSLTTPSTTFSLVNTTATTVNFAGAATTLNIGGNATILNFGGGATAAELRFLEPSASGTNFTAFKAVAQSADITYSLPATVGAAGTFLKDVAGNGVLSWAAGGGGGDALTANPLSQFAATTSLQLLGVISDETGTGLLVFGTSPAITTSITTPSTTFALINTTATTINFAGAATTLNLGGSATILNFGGGTTAAEFRFLEPSGSGTNFTAFKATTQAADITYTLPATVGAAGTFLKDVAGNGVLSWAAPAGGGDALTTNPLSQFAATTSAQLAGVISDEVGTGFLVFATAPQFTTGIGIGGTAGTGNSWKVYGTTSGSVTFAVPAIAGSNTLTFPAGTTDFSATGGTAQVVKQASAGAAFTVGTIAASEIASGAALSKTDDTNITMTLGGAPTTALLTASSLTLGWTGTLAVARGGIGVGTLASNGVLYGNGTSAVQALAVNSTATNKYLQQVSSGAPTWSTIPASEITAGAALTKVDDTNVTATLGGAATTALLATASITLGWTGTLAVARGGIGVGTLASNGVLYGNGTSAVQALAVNSTATNKFLTQVSSGAPAWNTIVAGDLPGSFSGFATPTTLIGMSVNAGVLTTGTRSDSTHAIDPAIAPPWTGTHTWSGGGKILVNTTQNTEGIKVAHTWTNGSGGAQMNGIELTCDYKASDLGTISTWYGLRSLINYGSVSVAATGTTCATEVEVVVMNAGSAVAEYAPLLAIGRMDQGTAASGAAFFQTTGSTGRMWLADYTVHGSVALQPNMMNGITMCMQNYYNGSPLDSPSAGMWIVTGPGFGGANNAGHATATTYKVDVGLGIVGIASSTGVGFTTGIQIGGFGSGWKESGSSRIGTAISFKDYDTYGLRFTAPYTATTPPAIVVEEGAGRVGLQMVAGTLPSTDLSFGGNAARVIYMERHTTSNVNGNDLTLQSGGTKGGAVSTDKSAGTLNLQTGIPTGTGTGVIRFWTAGGGTTGTADQIVTERMRIDGTGLVGIGTTAPTNILSFGGNVARTIWMERHTAADTAGNTLTLQAGGATSGATNKAGGNLIFQPGAPTGSGINNIIWNSYTGGTGAVATVHNVPSTAGTGYANGDTSSLTSGDTTASVTILTTSGGVVLTVAILATGTTGYQVGSGKATANITGTGTGLTVIITGITQTATADGTLTERMRLIADGSGFCLGLGTTAPASALTVSGTWVTTNGTFMTVAGSFLSSNTSQIAGLSVSTSIRPTGASIGSVYGLINIPSLAFSTANVTSTISGSFSRVDSAATYTGTIANARTFEAANPSLLGTNPASFYTHFYGAPLTNGNGSASAITNTGIDILVATAASGGGTFVCTGGKFGVPSGSAATQTNRGVWITGNGGASSTNWSLYSDSTAASSMVGSFSLGTQTAPTNAFLMLGAGTTTVAPIKFITATNLLTTPVAGCMEFQTDAYYVTTTTGAKRRMLWAGVSGRVTAQTAANASVATYTLGATDASYKVSANVLITTDGAVYTFTVTVDYTDEGNTARTTTFNFQRSADVTAAISPTIAAAGGAEPYMGIPILIRCKASTAITIKTAAGGTYTNVTYNAEGMITQVA